MKTKLFCLTILVAFATSALFSQDLIVKRDNSEMKVKVIEIQENSIKYKPFDFLEGPLRSISISDVLRIVYENGRVENFIIVESPKDMPAQVYVPEEITEPTTVQNNYYRPLRVFGRISGQMWNNDGLSEFFGTNPLFGAGIEKQVSSHFKFGADIDFASKTKDEATLNYTQFGGFIKFSWGNFGEGVVIYSELGVKGLSLKDIEGEYSEKYSGIGFSALLGLEIPLSSKVILNLGWNSIFGNIDIDGENLNVGSEIFSGGLLFAF